MKLLSKVLAITMVMMILLTIFTIPTIKDKNVLRTSFELEDITSLKTNTIYLLNENDLLVRVEIVNEDNTLIKEIENIIKYLTIDNKDIPKGLNGYLDKDIKVLNINLNNGLLTIKLNKFTDNDLFITGFTYSLLDLKGVDKVKIVVDDKELKFNESKGINNEYLYHSRKDVNKVVIYYLDNIYNNNYFVPVTKFVNDNREKIEIIIEELKNNKEMISMVDKDIVLLDYREENNVLFLNFNDKLASAPEEAIDAILYSSFANYDVNMVIFEVNNKELTYRKRY